MLQGKLKTHKRYIVYRAYCIVMVIVWNAIGLWEFTEGISKKTAPQYIPLLIPFMLPALFMVFSWAVFPWDYSIFGRYERTPFPSGEPILKYRSSWGKISWFHASIPFFTWSVYTSGLCIAIFGVGKVFIPVENIVELKSGFIRGYKLRHNCPELRNPVTLPNKRVFEAIQDILKRHGKHFA